MSYPTMHRMTRAAAAFLAALTLVAGGASAEDADAQAGTGTDPARARAVTQELLADANAALLAQDDTALRETIAAAFDFDIWARFLTEPRAARFTPEQLAEFRALLPGYLAHLYHEQFDLGLATPPTVGEARAARGDVLVGATFERADGDPLPVDWRLRRTPEGPRIIDIMVGGTSFLLIKRAEFSSMIDRGGVGSLLAYLEDNALE